MSKPEIIYNVVGYRTTSRGTEIIDKTYKEYDTALLIYNQLIKKGYKDVAIYEKDVS